MSRIEIIKDSSAPANEDWQIITGREHRRRPDYFRDKVTKREYSWLAGSMAWPVLAEQRDGCCIVVGTSRDERPILYVVDAVFAGSPRGLLEQWVVLRDRWGGKDVSSLFSSITGPEHLYQGMLLDFNTSLSNGTPRQRRLIIHAQPDADDPESDLLCVQAVRELAQAGRLKIEPEPVRDALRSMSLPDADRKLSDHPMVAAVAWLAYELVSSRPWLIDGDGKPVLMA